MAASGWVFQEEARVSLAMGGSQTIPVQMVFRSARYDALLVIGLEPSGLQQLAGSPALRVSDGGLSTAIGNIQAKLHGVSWSTRMGRCGLLREIRSCSCPREKNGFKTPGFIAGKFLL